MDKAPSSIVDTDFFYIQPHTSGDVYAGLVSSYFWHYNADYRLSFTGYLVNESPKAIIRPRVAIKIEVQHESGQSLIDIVGYIPELVIEAGMSAPFEAFLYRDGEIVGWRVVSIQLDEDTFNYTHQRELKRKRDYAKWLYSNIDLVGTAYDDEETQVSLTVSNRGNLTPTVLQVVLASYGPDNRLLTVQNFTYSDPLQPGRSLHLCASVSIGNGVERAARTAVRVVAYLLPGLRSSDFMFSLPLEIA